MITVATLYYAIIIALLIFVVSILSVAGVWQTDKAQYAEYYLYLFGLVALYVVALGGAAYTNERGGFMAKLTAAASKAFGVKPEPSTGIPGAPTGGYYF
jgi:hypothetical protein